MRRRFPSLVIRILIIGMLTLTGCHFPQPVSEPMLPAVTLTNTPAQPTPSSETVTPTTTATSVPSPTPVPPTFTPSPTSTPTWAYNQPGQVIAPILLYHHVDGENTDSRYRVSIPNFRDQMAALHDHGYTAITISMLIEALIQGRDLPEKPIVITFDDGHMSVYEHAFPIMSEFGFTGVFYIVANRINNLTDFVNLEQMTEMVNAGWEIGSHGYTHQDITKNHASAAYEIGQSRLDLQSALDIPINTFAYPYGEVNPFVAQKVNDYGYRAGMGLGTSITHTYNNLFYLSRIEIQGDYALEQFIKIVTKE
jgi:peptidoglycan/xylan/chitin deacetylase (PgdA/CDA1 family)